jgi:hypothetical protein
MQSSHARNDFMPLSTPLFPLPAAALPASLRAP